MATTCTTQGGVQVVRPDGDLAGPNVPPFRQALEGLLGRDERDYVIDLALAQTVDSAGLEALTWLQRESEQRLGGVRLCHTSPTVVTILRLTRLDDTWTCHAHLEDALASFG